MIRFTWAKSESIKDCYKVSLLWAKFMPISVYKFMFKNHSNNNFGFNFPEVEINCTCGRGNLNKDKELDNFSKY